MPQGTKTASRVAVEERRNGSLFTWAVEVLLKTLEPTAGCGGGGGADEPRLAGTGSRCPENECSGYQDRSFLDLRFAGLPGRLRKEQRGFP